MGACEPRWWAEISHWLLTWSANFMIWDDVANSCLFQVSPRGQGPSFHVADLTPPRGNHFTGESACLLQPGLQAFRVLGSHGGLVKGLPQYSCPSGLGRQAQALLFYLLLMEGKVKFKPPNKLQSQHQPHWQTTFCKL